MALARAAARRTAMRTSCRCPIWRWTIIKEAMADAGEGEPLFPCGDGSLSPVAVARTILRANEITKERPLGRFGIAPWSAHDLRRTALTGMARLGVAPIVLGHVANHRTTTRAGVTLGGLFAIHLRQGKARGARSVGRPARRDRRQRRGQGAADEAGAAMKPRGRQPIKPSIPLLFWVFVELMRDRKGGRPRLSARRGCERLEKELALTFKGGRVLPEETIRRHYRNFVATMRRSGIEQQKAAPW